MRLVFKFMALAVVFMPCAAGAQLLPPEPLYRDENWGLLTFHDETQRTCSLIAAQRPASSSSDGFLVIYVNRNARVSAEILRIELLNPPAQYLNSNRATAVLIDMGPAFTRSMNFYRLASVHPIVATNLRRDDLKGLGAALQPSGPVKSVRFENGTTWWFPPPASSDLATKLFDCWNKAGVVAPRSR